MMMDESKPTILISKCIEGEPCRYDGGMFKNSFVKELKNYVNVIEVCPEVEIGLPTPREALRLINKTGEIELVVSSTGENYTQKMNEFCDEFINKLKGTEIHGVILKSKSPSCGLKDTSLYKDFGKCCKLQEKVSGQFARKMLENYPQVAIEDDGRLSNYNIREQFLTRIFTIYDFDKVRKENSVKKLIDFQSRYKYLLMAYNQSKQKELGKIVAAATKKNLEDSLKLYSETLSKALSSPLKRSHNINMLLHLFGYFSKDLSKEEKSFFLDNLEMYHNSRVPFSVPLTIIKGWVIRFNNEYLLNQRIFEPYPEELITVTDSGKGI